MTARLRGEKQTKKNRTDQCGRTRTEKRRSGPEDRGSPGAERQRPAPVGHRRRVAVGSGAGRPSSPPNASATRASGDARREHFVLKHFPKAGGEFASKVRRARLGCCRSAELEDAKRNHVRARCRPHRWKKFRVRRVVPSPARSACDLKPERQKYP